MTKFRYEFETDMVKGMCHKCPLHYRVDTQWGWDDECVLDGAWDDCPLEEVAE